MHAPVPVLLNYCSCYCCRCLLLAVIVVYVIVVAAIYMFPKVDFCQTLCWNTHTRQSHRQHQHLHRCNSGVLIVNIIIIIIYPLTARVVGAPQMISQPISSIFLCSLLPSGTWQTPGLSIPWCCLPSSSSVCLVFFPLSLCLARWFWPDPMNGRHVHTTAVCVSLRSSKGLRVVRSPAGSWHRLPRW